MQYWLIATIEGACLGLALYLCVRVRIYLGPVIKDRFGTWPRRMFWFATILAMILISNAGLLVFRIYLESQPVTDKTLVLELWFAIVALMFGLALIFRRFPRNS